MKKSKPKSSKTAKGATKTSPKKAAKKELESGIAERFLEVVANLGHDAERIAKDIKKMSKEIAKKLSSKIKNVQNPTVKKQTKAQAEAAKREVRASRKELVKTPSRAERVVAKVTAKPESRPTVKHTPRVTSSDEVPKARGRRAPKPAENKGTIIAKEPVQRRVRKPEVAQPVSNNAVIESQTMNSENQNSREATESKSE